MPIIHGKAPFSPGAVFSKASLLQGAFSKARYACAGGAFAVEARTPACAAAPASPD